MIVDVHCHWTLTSRQRGPAARFRFEAAAPAAGPAGLPPPTHFDSCVSPRAARRLAFRAMRHAFGGGVGGGLDATLDGRIEPWMRGHLESPGPVERFVLLAFDAYHDHNGALLPLPEQDDAHGSDIYTSNSLVRDLCAAQPDRYLFGASIHPYRTDAPDCVDEVADAGAVLLKWLPLHQNIDIRDPRTLAVLRRCAARGLPVLVHYSQEFTLTTQHPEFRPIVPLLATLRKLRAEGTMPTTIVAHVATPTWLLGERDSYERLGAALLGEFADAPLYADISALANWGKVPFLLQLARRQELHGKLLFGSDFPVPLGMPLLRCALGREYRRLAREPSWPQRFAMIVRHLGFQEIVLHRAGELLRVAAAPQGCGRR